ncbi:hypothetical protein CV667_05115 [Borreliella burgdorferi]|uniref:DUF792 family protein n=1 Tax=Borreliella burgdorferi TaxID=139 RepID=UPI000D03332D|nr:DUF792 family protein [Borreliella burgdorferi]MCD2309315.1 DUF792 family protein [Borreliella burgdorferi]MCD2376715.1 DUF792 family protein [Borreliella burgdorferi]MCD2377176.1 DUF792 family protein [Borreliella burgdorferi]MCD2381500.1 DUF792 family protein [Borreliella burgdorferi]MCD2388375.1 DUF792 family protein [Borreliella burgdorferi]
MNINNKSISPGEILQIVKDVTTQIFALFGADNFLVLFPRPDFRGFGYIPQLFFIKPKNELITRTYTTTYSKRPVINYYNRKSEHVSYNPTMIGENISLSGGVLTSLYKEMLSMLKMTPFGNSMLRFDVHFAKEQLANRLQAQVPFSVYSPTFGLKELAIITSLTFKDTPFIDEIEVSLSMEIVKTFTLEKYKG